jgi:hypothetical protein
MGYQLYLFKNKNTTDGKAKRGRPAIAPIPYVVAVEVDREAPPVSPLEARLVWKILTKEEVANENASS